jgi:hypothetical protein
VYGASGGTFGSVGLPVTMRSAGTVTGATTSNLQWINSSGTGVAISSVIVQNAGTGQLNLIVSFGGGVTQSYTIFQSGTPIFVDSEL